MAIIDIDGEKHQVEDGKNLLEACLNLGLDLPYFCWHPSLGSVGSCRQCAVRVYADENDKTGRILMSCMTPVTDNMRLSLSEPEVKQFRDQCIEVTMANHPHDCPVCEEGGECHLQDMTIMSDHTERRYRGQKKTYNNQYLGPCISHEMNRCITCYRCVRFYNDYAGGKDLAAMGSKENVYFGRHEDGCLENIFSGNLVDVCPTGVFTDKTFARSYNRKWDLQTAPSICEGCSLGCNTAPGEREGSIKRISNRYHGEINGYFLCDKGRFGYDHINHAERIRQCYTLDEKQQWQETDYQSAINAAAGLMLEEDINVIGIGSERASVEENFLLKTLVGSENFCSGYSGLRSELLEEILAIYQSQYTTIASIKDIEACDAVIVLGEDLLNSAPRMALSVRQATRNLSFELAEKTRIPVWQDAAVRTLAQDQRSPLIIVSVAGTELDEIASHTCSGTPQDITVLAYAIAHAIDKNSPTINGLNEGTMALVNEVAEILVAAKNPLIISGTSLNSSEVIKGSAQISYALSRRRSNGSAVPTKVSYVLPEVNSMGMAVLTDEHTLSVEQMIEKVCAQPQQHSLLVLKNDLYKHASTSRVDAAFEACKHSIAIDQYRNRTVTKASVVIPASQFVETEGTVVNNEGRAQRFFEVFSTDNPSLKDNWKTLVNIAGQIDLQKKSSGSCEELAKIESFDDVVELIEKQGGVFAHWSKIAPSAKFRIAGMKVPRQPHRYSGRTSLKANIKVAENKQPQDGDSALGFSMEGAPTGVPPALNALNWAPGWNSNEAVNKFQDEMGGHLKEGDAGLRLIETADIETSWYGLENIANAGGGEEILAVSQTRLFDGCEFANRSAALAQRASKRAIQIHPNTAARHALNSGDLIEVSVDQNCVRLPVELNVDIVENTVMIPDDVITRADFPSALLPTTVNIRTNLS